MDFSSLISVGFSSISTICIMAGSWWFRSVLAELKDLNGKVSDLIVEVAVLASRVDAQGKRIDRMDDI